MRERYQAWKAGTSTRERVLLGLGALVVVAGLAWALVLDPLARDLAATESSLREKRVALAAARWQAEDVAALAKAPAPAAPDVRASVERVLAQRGLRGAVTSLQARDARVELTFEAIDFAALTGLIDALGREARLFPVDALLAARTAPGTVRAEIVLVPPPAP